tara:strand:- start:250 stop:558 length:309 start_codon:yes stop_codon:yes gene_type:complete
MIIYNVTVSVEESITNDWLDWMKIKHIPEVMACGVFTKAQINRVITQGDSNNTFAIAYNCASMKDLHQYQINFSDKLQQKHIARYGDKVVAFRTIMESVKEF